MERNASSFFPLGLPPNVKHTAIINAFSARGVSLVAIIIQPEKQRAIFSSFPLAEKAYALMNGRAMPKIQPPIVLVLSASAAGIGMHPTTAVPRQITSLPSDITESRLYDMLRQFGPINSLRVTGNAYATVQFCCEEDACNAECGQKYLDWTVNAAKLSNIFTKFGSGVSAKVMCNRTGRSRGFGRVSFQAPQQASKAIEAMDGYVVEGKAMKVQYELIRGSATRTVQPTNAADSSSESTNKQSSAALGGRNAQVSDAEDFAPPVIPSRHVTVDHRSPEAGISEQDDAQTAIVHCCNEAARLETDLAELRTQSAANNDKWCRQFSAIEIELRDEITKRQAAQDALAVEEAKMLAAETSLAAEEAKKLQAEESLAVAETKRHQTKGALKVEQVARQMEVAELRRQLEILESRRKILELENDRRVWEESKRKKEASERAEPKRETELAEKRRRMRDLLEKEAAQKRAADAERQRKAVEEKARLEQAEKARKAHEAEERERQERELRQATARREQERRDQARREQARKLAALKERRRYRERDDLLWEAFFKAAKGIILVPEYKSLLEKSHRMMHPDKWKSPNILKTCGDDTLRERLEKAGNITAQALTPLWRESRK